MTTSRAAIERRAGGAAGDLDSRRPSAAWGYLALVALLSTGVQYLQSFAYRRGRTPLITGLDYLRLIWSGLLAWVFFNEIPDALSLAGMLLVVGCGLGILGGEVRDPGRGVAAALATKAE